MKVRVLALDFDGTIAVDRRLDGEVADAIRDARQADVMTVLVSERMLADVQALLPAPDLFDAIVAEVLSAHGENVLVSGDPRSGQSWVAGLAAECLIEAGYGSDRGDRRVGGSRGAPPSPARALRPVSRSKMDGQRRS